MQRKLSVWALALAAGLVVASVTQAAIPAKKGPLTTKWGESLDREHPWAEYPRPALTRADWMNLNGTWEFQPGKADDPTPAGKTLSAQILVPFCPESALSGVMEHHDRVWYRRMFTVPKEWAGKQVRINFGAVDFESEVFVNGTSLGVHKGGYLPFSYDITPALKGDGEQEVIVRVFDPTIEGGQPRGKQTTTPQGIMYTPTTGIWQTVWLEPVAKTFVSSLKITPDIDNNTVKITVNSPDAPADATVSVKVLADGGVVKTIDGKANTELTVPIENAKLWSPDSPYLYDLEATVFTNGAVADTVKSYFGMRKISIGEENGIKKMFLNNKFMFEMGPLDQGFWPDGIYTPPSDEAIHAELQGLKDFGFNMIRKHIKVEPARWYYWTDKLGFVVWQDMPSANSYMGRGQKAPPVDRAEYKKELTEMVQTLISTTSIIMWDTFNEGQGQHDAPALVALVKELDPSRLVNEASGGRHTGHGDIFDEHPYPAPRLPKASDTQAIAIGEYGGIGLPVKDHTWDPKGGHTYVDVSTPKDVEEMYGEFSNLLKDFRDNHGLSAAVYTQVSDVETELNGLWTYDRQLKVDPKQIAKANHFQYPPTTYTEVMESSEKQSQPWKYVTTEPKQDWAQASFDDASWTQGAGGFGTEGTPSIGKIGTEWKTGDIWLRKTFDLKNMSDEQVNHLVLRVYNDDGCEVFINGVRAFGARDGTGSYSYRQIRREAKAALKKDGPNVIAVHCHQNGGGQYIDVGIVEKNPPKE